MDLTPRVYVQDLSKASKSTNKKKFKKLMRRAYEASQSQSVAENGAQGVPEGLADVAG